MVQHSFSDGHQQTPISHPHPSPSAAPHLCTLWLIYGAEQGIEADQDELIVRRGAARLLWPHHDLLHDTMIPKWQTWRRIKCFKVSQSRDEEKKNTNRPSIFPPPFFRQWMWRKEGGKKAMVCQATMIWCWGSTHVTLGWLRWKKKSVAWQSSTTTASEMSVRLVCSPRSTAAGQLRFLLPSGPTCPCYQSLVENTWILKAISFLSGDQTAAEGHEEADGGKCSGEYDDEWAQMKKKIQKEKGKSTQLKLTPNSHQK